MKKLSLCLILFVCLAQMAWSSDDLTARLNVTQDLLIKLQESRNALDTAIKQSEKSDQLYIPVKIENDWAAVPFEKSDLEALMNIWILWENESAQQATANAQSLFDFSSNYRTALNDKLKDIDRQIELAKTEKLAISQQLEKIKREKPATQSSIATTWTTNASHNIVQSPPGPQPKNRAEVTVAIENIKPAVKEGSKKWDFEWVFTEHNGIGVTFTAYELFLRTSTPGSEKVIKNDTHIRIEGGHVFRGPGFMSVENPDTSHIEENDLHAQMHAIYRGKDDNGYDVFVENYFFQ